MAVISRKKQLEMEKLAQKQRVQAKRIIFAGISIIVLAAAGFLL
jgi:hypothetical protein